MDASRTVENGHNPIPNKLGFWALFATQFQGAFNDNLFKFLVIYFLVGLYAQGADDALRETETNRITTWATMAFSLPYIIFPGLFGALSDRYSKRIITIWAKYLEVVVMLLGAAAFLLGTTSALWFLLFCMAAQSAFFSPSKYGILPEILPESRLSWGNGVIALGTMVAIVLGAGLAGPLYEGLTSNVYLAGILLSGLSCAGVLTSYFVTRVPAAAPGCRIPVNPWSGMWRYFKVIAGDRILLVAMVGYVYFWFAGAFMQTHVFSYGANTLRMSPTEISIMQVCLAIGIGVGSLAAGYLSKGKIELGLVVWGGLGLGITSTVLFFPQDSHTVVLFWLSAMGFFAGVFNVPLAAAIQHRSPDDAKGGLMATMNMLTFLGMFVAAGLLRALNLLGTTNLQVFLVSSALTVAVVVYMCVAEPYFVVRAVLWIFTNTFYKVRVYGRENVPLSGGALLTPNHMSFLDPGAVMAGLDRPVAFMAYRAYVESKWLSWLGHLGHGIPIAHNDGREALRKSLEEASQAIRDGELLCVFPEGGITRTGQLTSFQRGYQRIMKDVDAPVIPVYIDGMWGSIFSFSGGRFFKKWPQLRRRVVSVYFGKPLPHNVSSYDLRNAVQDLMAEAWSARKYKPGLLHRVFIKTARRHPRLTSMADARTGALPYYRVLAGSVVLARKLKKILDKQPMVGVLVPPTVGGALANIALPMMGRMPINLNYTSNDATLERCAQRCNMTYCITAKAFLERVPVKVPATPIYLEDVMKSVTPLDRIIGLVLGLFCPVRLLEWTLGYSGSRSPHDLFTIVFSSGSEGEPKGVMLTHFGILSNAKAAAQVYAYRTGDAMMGFLPFFHSFGLLGTLWAPTLNGLTAVFHPSPLEPQAIGKLVEQYKCRFLVSTPTFLQSFIKRCPAEQLKSLDFVICGAEKLPARVRDAYREKFGADPIEGYGATECSPALAANIPDFPVPGHGVVQIGNRPGTVGRPLPGITLRVVDPDTGEELGQDQPGLLKVKGPNIMRGYLGMPEKTAQVLHDGWYETGDIVRVDEDGFIAITDRLARFSKIAGEMVPHTNVEEVLHGLLGLTEQALAVAGVPDASRGERIVVLHTLEEDQVQVLLERLNESDMPNLWRPKPAAFHRVKEIPVLGTGKMDIKAVRAMALELDTDPQ